MKIRGFHFTIFVLFLVFTFGVLRSQNISGTVNLYTNVTAIAGPVVTVGSAAGFAACDRVMIIQMKGATINTTNNASFGQITAYGNAGNYEFATVASIAGNQITLSTPLALTYTTTGAVQLIRVPSYTNPTVTGTLTCAPWNGITGGVLVFESTGPVTLNANIDVQGRGFVGGTMIAGGFGCANANYATGVHGKKGEGIATAPAGLDAHRAPLANGGGGSTPGNGGSGGGGNFGAGGRGGNEYSGCGATGVFGLGGYPLTTLVTKAFMGGGGGGGFRDNGQPCAAGTNGGGIVMINAPSIAGNGFSILASGSNNTVITRDEGAGAGGAGGSVYLRVPVFTSALAVNVNGGSGGNIQNTIFTSDAHGPGGGGGGGYVWVTTAGMPANLAVTSNGGAAGIIQHAGAYFNTTYSAAAGSPGSTLFNLPNIVVPISQTFPPVNLGPDTLGCGLTNITLQPDTVYASYLWSNGATTPTINVTASGTYWLECPIGCGLFDRDSIVVTIGNPIVNLGADQSICAGDSIQFNAGAGFTNYAWNTGASASAIYTNSAGQYIVTVTDASGCTDSDTAELLNVFPLPILNLGADINQCGGNVLLNAGAGYANYNWQNGSSADNFTVSSTGIFWVQVTDINNCSAIDSIDIVINPVPIPNLGADISFCSGQTANLNPGLFTNYFWNTGEVTQTITVSAAGTYSVTVTNAVGCTNSDTLIVQNVYPLPQPILGQDITFCDGQTRVLNPGVFNSYQWQDNSGLPVFTVSNSGTYFVEVTDVNNCINSDTVIISVNPLPVFSLGLDLKICPGDNIELSPNGLTVPVSYNWNDNSTNGTLIIYDIGAYYLTVTDVNLCLYTDTLNVEIECPWTIYVPNAFTPNPDEINPHFKAYGTNIKEFKMEIFDRWGVLIHTLNALSESWDGTINGVPAPIGHYVYKVSYQNYIKADDIYLIGGFSLIR